MGREIWSGSVVDGEVIVLVKGGSDGVRDIQDVLCFRGSMIKGLPTQLVWRW